MRKYDSDLSKATPEDRAIFDAADGVAEYDKCVAISTQASIKEMVMPGLLAIIVPVFIGFVGGAEMLGGLLAGVTASGVLMAIFQSNAGGAWDNAKKTIEKEGRKGSDAHKAAVVGDTVGDPFKDTSGPSLNILLKLMSVVALVIAPSLVEADALAAYTTDEVSKEVTVDVRATSGSDDSMTYAVIRTVTNVNGVQEVEEVTYEGRSVEEVMDQVKANHPEVELNVEKDKTSAVQS